MCRKICHSFRIPAVLCTPFRCPHRIMKQQSLLLIHFPSCTGVVNLPPTNTNNFYCSSRTPAQVCCSLWKKPCHAPSWKEFGGLPVTCAHPLVAALTFRASHRAVNVLKHWEEQSFHRSLSEWIMHSITKTQTAATGFHFPPSTHFRNLKRSFCWWMHSLLQPYQMSWGEAQGCPNSI